MAKSAKSRARAGRLLLGGVILALTATGVLVMRNPASMAAVMFGVLMIVIGGTMATVALHEWRGNRLQTSVLLAVLVSAGAALLLAVFATQEPERHGLGGFLSRSVLGLFLVLPGFVSLWVSRRRSASR